MWDQLLGAQMPRPDLLIYASPDGVIWGQTIDPRTAERLGEPVSLVTGVAVSLQWAPLFTVSPSGTLTYREGRQATDFRQSTIRVALDGNARAPEVLDPLPRGSRNLTWSPEGDRIARVYSGSRTVEEETLDLIDVGMGTARRTLARAEHVWRVAWTPDGETLATLMGGDSLTSLVLIDVESAAADTLLSWEPTDRLAWRFHAVEWVSANELLLGGREPGLLEVVTRSGEVREYLRLDDPPTGIALSPDGEWLAIEQGLDDGLSGRVQLRSFPVPGPPIVLDVGPAGFGARWGPSGGRTLPLELADAGRA